MKLRDKHKQCLGANGGTKITDANIIPSLHIYPGAWNQNQQRVMTVADIDTLASAKRSLIIGEFGEVGSGNTDWKGIVKYAKSNGYTVLAWAWNGDGSSATNMVCFWIISIRGKTPFRIVQRG